MITSTSSNVVWTPDERVANTAHRASSAGKAIVGADEEVLCWDVKRGELLGRWKDSDFRAEVTTIAQSRADPEIYAVGLVKSIKDDQMYCFILNNILQVRRRCSSTI